MSRPHIDHFRAVCVLSAIAALSACTAPTPGAEFNDPYEEKNRAVYESSIRVDRNVLRPAGRAAAAIPTEITDRVSNFADNVSLPGMVVNGLLQGDIGGMGTNTMRFVINTTVGIGGLFDPAGAIGLGEESTDFGETLAVWGVPEGAYLVVPVFGPTTERDAVGRIVDIFMNPLKSVGTDVQIDYGTVANVADIAIKRGRYMDTIDSVLYDSADSYAQARLAYLLKRRFDLGEEPTADSEIDPFSSDLSLEGFE